MIKPQIASIQKDENNFFLSHTKLNLLHFRASDNVVPIQPGDTSNVEETSNFTAEFALHKMLKVEVNETSNHSFEI